jgi:uncharacterized protein (TIGR03435 family)
MTLADLSPWANHLWQSTLCAFVAWLLTLTLRRNRAALRYWVWLAASVKFLIPFSLLVGAGSQLGWRAAPAIAQPQFSIVMDEISRPFAAPPPAVRLAGERPASDVFRAVLFGVWLCGFAIASVSWLRRWRRLRAVQRAATPLSLNLPIRVMSSPARLEPGVFGIRTPVLLLPEGITDRLTPPQLEAVLAHELCHVRRRDNLTAMIHMLVEAIFWFHPLVWWIRERLVEERERACDEEVLRGVSEPEIYAEGILNVCRFYLASPLVCMSGVTGSNLKSRIEAIMANRTGRKLSLSRAILLAVTGLAALTGPVVMGILHPAASRAQSEAATKTLPAFEVASVKLTQHGRTPDGWSHSSVDVPSPGSFVATNASMEECIRWAYGVKEYQISGPEWLNSDAASYDIAAKAPAGATKNDIRLMVQALLAERFKLAIHRETRMLPVYELVTAKNGPKLQTAIPGETDGISSQGGSVKARAVTMAFFAATLSRYIGTPVFDKTGLSGAFDFSMEYARDDRDSADKPSIFTAVQEQLGLKLEKAKGPVEILVIDHAEKAPTEN